MVNQLGKKAILTNPRFLIGWAILKNTLEFPQEKSQVKQALQTLQENKTYTVPTSLLTSILLFEGVFIFQW